MFDPSIATNLGKHDSIMLLKCCWKNGSSHISRSRRLSTSDTVCMRNLPKDGNAEANRVSSSWYKGRKLDSKSNSWWFLCVISMARNRFALLPRQRSLLRMSDKVSVASEKPGWGKHTINLRRVWQDPPKIAFARPEVLMFARGSTDQSIVQLVIIRAEHIICFTSQVQDS